MYSATTASASRNADGEIEDRSRILRCRTRRADPFTSLPPEVITHVLSYLPLRDRKSVRLTSKVLNECSKYVSIVKEEKFVFPGSRAVSSSRIRKFLLRTNYVPLNLEFHGTEHRTNSLPFGVWRTCGDRVRSLYFNSFLETQVLVDIFMNCRNLQVFGCRDSKHNSSYYLRQASDLLILSDVVCTELHTLTFYAGPIDSSLLQKIFTVFPNIKHLHATYWDLESKTESLKPFTQLQSFTYSPGPSERISWLEYVTRLELPIRLTELCVNLGRSHLKSDDALSTLLRFLESQNQLEKLSLTASGIHDSGRRKLLMFHALRCCPKLREFVFQTFDMRLKTSDEALEFFALIANLQRLELRSLPRIPNGVPLPRTNFALNMLTLSSDPKRFVLFHILKHSPKLQYLMIGLGDLTTETFKAILRHGPELRTLGLNGRVVGDELSSPVDDCYIKKLENLEYLELEFRPHHPLPIRKIQFRRMKHVKFDFIRCFLLTHSDVVDQLFEVLWNMPTVETIQLPHLKLENLREYVELFRYLKNLRRLVCGEVESDDLALLFKACPTLKFVSTGSRAENETFSFDSSAERVISEPFLTLKAQGCMSSKDGVLGP